MKAMILAAGLGTRMRPLTLETPKPLLTVAGKPLIVWHIEALQRAGITQIVINAAWLADTLMAALGDGHQWGVQITWSREDSVLETAGGIIQALPLLGDAPFVLVNGDVWTRFDFAQLVDLDLGADLAHLVLVDNPPQHTAGDFVLAAGRVYRDDTALSEQTLTSRLTFAGISVLSPRLFDGLKQGKAPLAPILRDAMDLSYVSGVHTNAKWVDVGTVERLEQLNAQVAAEAI